MMDVIKTEDEEGIAPAEHVHEAYELAMRSKNFSIWSSDETKQLLDLFKDFISEVGPLKRFRHKKDMWNEIASQISTKNSKQCEERIKTLLRRKKKGIENICSAEANQNMFDIDDDGEENEFEIARKLLRLSESKVDSCSTGFKQIQVWSNYETKLLMELYNRLICEVGPRKRFIHKKDMWAEISTNFVNKNSKQCQERYKTVLRRKNRSLTKTIYISKARRETIDFKAKDSIDNAFKIKRINAFNKINKITNDKPNIEENHKQDKANSQKNPTIAANKDVFSINATLLKILAKNEKGRERRHREKMKAIARIQNILQEIMKCAVK